MSRVRCGSTKRSYTICSVAVASVAAERSKNLSVKEAERRRKDVEDEAEYQRIQAEREAEAKRHACEMRAEYDAWVAARPTMRQT